MTLAHAGDDHAHAAIERVLEERREPALLVIGIIEVNYRVTGLKEAGAQWGELCDGGLHTARDTLLWNCGLHRGKGPKNTDDSTIIASSARATLRSA